MHLILHLVSVRYHSFNTIPILMDNDQQRLKSSQFWSILQQRKEVITKHWVSCIYKQLTN